MEAGRVSTTVPQAQPIALDAIHPSPSSGMGFISPEELPMTMQIGIVGSDGVILASDMQWFDETGTRVTYDSSKIVFDSTKGIAVGCSGSSISRIVQNRIVEDLAPNDFEYPYQPVKRIVQSVLTNVSYRDTQWLIVLDTKPRVRLFSLQIQGSRPDLFDFIEVPNKMYAGDAKNSAVFFSETYYDRRPVEQLEMLAAHVILTAPRLNNAGIGGLEILVCDKSGFRMLLPDEIQELEKRSNALHETIRNGLR
jgi:20S proteasome alpha/beta subunit